MDIHTRVKQAGLIILFFFYCNALSAQTMPDFDLIKMEQAGDYKKAEPFVLQTANFLLMSPYKNSAKDAGRGKCIQFLEKWLVGTNEYAFPKVEAITKITRQDNALLEMYLVSMIKYAIENKKTANDAKVIKLNAVSKLIEYCEQPGNNLKMNKPLKKLAEAKAKGELEQALAEYQ